MMLYLDGAIVAAEQAGLSPLDRGFTLGDGLFETIKVRHGRALRLEAHLARLSEGAAILRLSLPHAPDWLDQAVGAVMAANDLRDAALRLTISRGPAPRGLLPPVPGTPTVVLTAGTLPPPPGPVRAVVARTVRRNAYSPLARCKSLCYLDNVLARIEAEERGGDDALLLNTDGRLAESTIANLFVVGTDGILATPPVSDGALPGVRRGELLRSMVALERRLGVADLLAAREAFLCNALSIRPLVAVDGVPIGDGRPGPLSERLRKEADDE